MKKLWLKAKFFLATILGKADRFIEKHAETGIAYAAQIKKFVNSDIVNMVVLFTPTSIDDVALTTAKKIIEKVVVELDIVRNCKDLPTEQERLQCFIRAVKDLSEPMQDAVFMKFASLFAKIASGVKERQNVFDTAVQVKYFERTLK